MTTTQGKPHQRGATTKILITLLVGALFAPAAQAIDATQWQALAPNSTQKSIPHGVRMTAPSAVTTDDVLEVIESGEGSRATFYKGSFLSGDKLRVAARECLE